MPVPPDSPGSTDWHEGKPGLGCSLEDIRWFAIREIGKLQETTRFNGRHLHNLKSEVDILKETVGTKAEASLVVNELDRLRTDTGA